MHEKRKPFDDENQIRKVNKANSQFILKKRSPLKKHKIQIKTSLTECIPGD